MLSEPLESFLLSTHFPSYDFDLRASHARTLLPAALASVQFVFVLVRVRVRVLPAAINTFVKSLHCADHHPIRIGDERERLVTASPVMTIAGTPAGENNYPENGLVKPPRRDTRASAQPVCSEERRRTA